MKKLFSRLLKNESGAVNTNVIATCVGLVLIAVSFIVFPIVLEGAEEVRLATNVSEYTGLSSLVSIGPTLVFVGLLFGGVMSTFFGIRGFVKGRG